MSAKKQPVSADLAKLAEEMSNELPAIATLAAALENQRKYPLPLLSELRTRLKPLLELSR